MRKIFLLLGLLVCFSGFSQNPDYHRFGARSKYYQPDTLSTTLRDALTPKLGTILYHKDTGISQWEQWDGSEWVEFGGEYDVVPRDSLIVQSPSSLGNIYHYWKGTEAQQDSILGLDPNFFDDMLWICTDCPQQGGGGTANQFVMGDSSFKDFIDDDTFASATSTNIPSAESVKAYVDNNTVTVTSGTFTPTLVDAGGGATYTIGVSNCRYTKIGNLVFIYLSLSSISTSGSPSGILQIQGLPYSKHSSDAGNSAISVSWFRLSSLTSEQLNMLGAHVPSGSDDINFTTLTATLSSVTFTSPGAIEVAGTYITND